MNTNEKEPNSKIAKWLGIKKHKCVSSQGESYSYINENIDKESNENREVEYLNFLHDRNQQKWIEDKLIELGYVIVYQYVNIWMVTIINKKPLPFVYEKNESKDLAFISAVEQLIDKG
jgi:hypothetical protein